MPLFLSMGALQSVFLLGHMQTYLNIAQKWPGSTHVPRIASAVLDLQATRACAACGRTDVQRSLGGFSLDPTRIGSTGQTPGFKSTLQTVQHYTSAPSLSTFPSTVVQERTYLLHFHVSSFPRTAFEP